MLNQFGGTGTTAFVAKQLKRHYITIEVSKTYFKVINDRLNDLFNQKEEQLCHILI
ncbi:MAG: DNA methyltransferase [Candidatus Poribacteria bacterium]